MSARPLLEVHALRKTFGKVEAVRGVDFAVEAGSVVGFIGANGAGKTTTMRMLATLELPDAGQIRVQGVDVSSHPEKVRSLVGWMPDNFGVYKNTSVYDYLDFFARAQGLRGRERAARLAEVMAFTDLDVIADRDADKLSKGMGQRLCLGRTLLHDPELLILDEPAAGLDPKARIEFKNLVALLAERGKTVFISSHILSELGEMCDTMLFIDGGRIVHHGTAESLTRQEQAGLLVEVRVAGDSARLLQWVSLQAGVELVTALPEGARLRFENADPAAVADTLARLIGDGVPVIDFHREERKLEDAFIDLLKTREKKP